MLRLCLALDYFSLNFLENVLEDFFQKLVPKALFVPSDVALLKNSLTKTETRSSI